jgi:hypothetical protein
MYIIFCEYMNNVGSTINTQCLLDFYSIIIMVLHIRPFDLQIFQLRVFEIHKKFRPMSHGFTIWCWNMESKNSKLPNFNQTFKYCFRPIRFLDLGKLKPSLTKISPTWWKIVDVFFNLFLGQKPCVRSMLDFKTRKFINLTI